MIMEIQVQKPPLHVPPTPQIANEGKAASKATKLRGLAREIRERTDGLSEQINVMIRISLDDAHKGQVDAIKWLAERAYGRTPEISAFAELDQAEAQEAIQALSAAQLETIALAASALAKAKGLEPARAL